MIPIKLIANECIKLADQFVPELVETLASEMNPDTVCSVAGRDMFNSFFSYCAYWKLKGCNRHAGFDSKS